MNVLSLFDGISCGQLALQRAGIKYNQYFASEIDKHAIKVTQHHFPNTVQLGNVTQVDAAALPQIDLLIGGSPCQGFSFAGKKINFEDPRSKLFFEYVRLKNELKPKWFLLENVKMKKESQDIISEHMGVEPILIDSADFSAQRRKRLYWTNIPIAEWVDKNLTIESVFSKDTTLDITERYNAKNQGTLAFEKSRKALRSLKDKANPILTGGQNIANSSATNINVNTRVYTFTPLGSERLQTIPDNYTAILAKTQRYRTIGNGWTVDVIAHILNGVKQC